jgi:hypothetical protein
MQGIRERLHVKAVCPCQFSHPRPGDLGLKRVERRPEVNLAILLVTEALHG